MRNDGGDGAGGWTFTEIDTDFGPSDHVQSAWADYDGDLDLDLLLVHLSPLTEEGFIRRFRNDGDGVFFGEEILGTLSVEHGEAQWGDADDDGDLDILVAGNIRETDGTYDTDLLFYAPGSGPDALWVGNGDGVYAITPKTINGNYKPFVGNFDLAESYPEAQLTDILWYAPGQAADSVWMNNGSSFSSTPLTINAANYQPYVVPRLLGGDAIMWNNTSGQDYQWQPTGSHAFEITSTPVTNMGNRTPIVGRFDDKAPRVHASYPWGTDVLWAEPGNLTAQKEVFWAGDDSSKWVIPVQS